MRTGGAVYKIIITIIKLPHHPCHHYWEILQPTIINEGVVKKIFKE